MGYILISENLSKSAEFYLIKSGFRSDHPTNFAEY